MTEDSDGIHLDVKRSVGGERYRVRLTHVGGRVVASITMRGLEYAFTTLVVELEESDTKIRLRPINTTRVDADFVAGTVPGGKKAEDLSLTVPSYYVAYTDPSEVRTYVETLLAENDPIDTAGYALFERM